MLTNKIVKDSDENVLSEDEDDVPYCHILQASVTYEGKTIIDSIPVGFSVTLKNNISDLNGEKIYVEQNTGFKYVIYNNGGTEPQYANGSNFILYSKDVVINNELVSVQLNNLEWQAVGKYPVIKKDNYGSIIEWEKSENLEQDKNEQEKFIPIKEYNGVCLSDAIVMTGSGTTPGTQLLIHLPIHFLQNRYENPKMNDWDGNSVQVDDDLILAPLIGAGHKEKDNSFTGV